MGRWSHSAGARRRDRARGHRPASRPFARAGDHRGDLACSAERIAHISETEVGEALGRLDPLWDELFPAEQARIVRLLVERIDISLEGISIRLDLDGLAGLCGDLTRELDAVAQ